MEKYQHYLEKKYQEFENYCRRCGDCCVGADKDPCKKLAKDENNLYYCNEYGNRLGNQMTISGKKFQCVSIMEHVRNNSLSKRCGYNFLKKQVFK